MDKNSYKNANIWQKDTQPNGPVQKEIERKWEYVWATQRSAKKLAIPMKLGEKSLGQAKNSRFSF